MRVNMNPGRRKETVKIKRKKNSEKEGQSMCIINFLFVIAILSLLNT